MAGGTAGLEARGPVLLPPHETFASVTDNIIMEIQLLPRPVVSYCRRRWRSCRRRWGSWLYIVRREKLPPPLGKLALCGEEREAAAAAVTD